MNTNRRGETMRQIIVFTLLLPVLVAAWIPSGVEAGIGARLETHTLQHNGVERRFLLYTPPVSGARRAPLVLVLHGGGGHGENVADMTGFTDKARREGFFVAYPDGSGKRRGRLLTWNARHCCGYAMTRHVDDVGFIRTLIATLVRDLPVDPARIYVTGLSNGGMMTHRLGIELSGTVAAIAPVVAGLFGDEPPPAGPVPILIINGALDDAVPPAGGPPGGRAPRAWDGTPVKPAAYQAEFWATANRCDPQPERNSTGSGHSRVDVWRYRCPAGGDVVRYLVGDNGHAWPGGHRGSRRGDTPSEAVDATDLIWDFFKNHSRPAR